MIHKIQNTKKSSAGFTLIELLVATSIFLITITVGITSLLMMNRTHHITQYKKEQFDALHAVMEDMVRNIRVATHLRCDIGDVYTTVLAGGGDPMDISTAKSCINTIGDDMPANDSMAFEPIDGNPQDNTDQVGYYITTDPVLNKGVIFKSTDIDFTSNPGTGYSVRVSPDSVDIDLTKSGFTVIHAEDSDLKQPLVIIRLAGTVTYQNDSTPFSLQTTVIQRNPKL